MSFVKGARGAGRIESGSMKMTLIARGLLSYWRYMGLYAWMYEELYRHLYRDLFKDLYNWLYGWMYSLL